MKKLVVSLAVLGLMGVAPAQAHNQPKVKCSATILSVGDLVTDSTGSEYREVTVETTFKNKTSRNLQPSMDLVFFDKYVDDDGFERTARDIHGHQPGKVKAGTTKTETGTFIVTNLEELDGLKVANCHRSWRT